MQIHLDRFSSLRACLAGLVLLCLFVGTTQAVDPQPSPIQSEIFRLQDLSETQVAESIKQLSELKRSLPADTALEDQREALIALIGLYLNDDQNEPAGKLNAELNALGQRYHDNWSNAMVLNFQAAILRGEGKLQEAKKVNAQAMQLAKIVNVKRLTSRVNSTASVINSALGDFQIALQYQLAAMDALEEGSRHDDLQLINALNNIGNLYLSLKDPQMALEYYSKGTRLAEKMDDQIMLGMLAGNRGYAYSTQGKLTDAIKAYTESLAIARQLSDRRSEATALNNLSDAAYRLDNYSLCLQYAKQTLQLVEKIGNSGLKASGLVNLGLCHMGLGEVQLGAGEVNQGIDILRKSNAKPDIESVLGQLATAYEKAGMYRDAYKAIVEELALSTELFQVDRDRAVSELKAKYDASQREKQIEVLEQKNQVQSVEIKNKGLQRIIATLSTIIAIAVALTILFLYRKVRETNRNLEEANVKLAHQSTRDPLTGLLNRRAFHDAMQFRTQITERRSLGTTTPPPHALVMLDIDHFKRINDNYGHAAGDSVLVELSKRLTHVMRDKDMLMRWGGEEFLVFLNHIPTANLPQVVERILISVGGRQVPFENNTMPVTISAGYISLQQGDTSEVDPNWEKMLNLADSALYMAKTRGRNQAIGIKVVNVKKEEFDALLEGDLENSIKQGKVIIEQIAGPEQHEAMVEH
ncbi:tetratricopeptide repeat-containing diguanylate cyclase [Solimicrobium silvestre]|uniref:diguanylate cyclase n=1 Tax=Solimicrobium silvestre TaxID=2099400 RepID=A0A2S9H2R4_9BURK|nr:diguanylate cyclase [Solimicrobium silvestre]PRC94247.1 GGDEF: diguanylate cyclase (GGDEF) domain [Solimicrobium silvestre]